MPGKISVILPVFNEALNALAVCNAIKNEFINLPQYEYEIIFVNDGSEDTTLENIKQLAAASANVFYISFSRNFGKDSALMAGLQYSSGDAVITMDADLQHPPALIPELLKHWENGSEVVYTYRNNKNRHAGILAQLNSKIFYNTLNKLSEIKLENGIADYRLMDRKVADVVVRLKENNPFVRGLLKWVGFKQTGILYTPDVRLNGESRYRTIMLFKLALTGITSFSTKPLTFAIYIGFFFSFASIFYIPYVVYSLVNHLAISGWASIIVTIVFFGGIQLMILGIIGLYLGKTFMQAKDRPQYIVSESNLNRNILKNGN